MGFTQRQAGGKFTADEADAFIEQLETAEYEADQAAQADAADAHHTAAAPAHAAHPANAAGAVAADDAAPVRAPIGADDPIALAAALLDFTSEQLLAELRRRGVAVAIDD